MFKKWQIKNAIGCNELIISAMLKRRRYANAAISNICENKSRMRVVK